MVKKAMAIEFIAFFSNVKSIFLQNHKVFKNITKLDERHI